MEMTFKIMKMKFPWNLWILILILVNLMGGIYFFSTFEGKLVAISFLSAAFFMSYLYSKYGFTKILGLGHVLWLPMMGILIEGLFRGASYSAEGLKEWIIAVVIINILSLILDFIDILKYLAGETAPS